MLIARTLIRLLILLAVAGGATRAQAPDTIQRISISPDGAPVFTQDRDAPRVAAIDAATNKVSARVLSI